MSIANRRRLGSGVRRIDAKLQHVERLDGKIFLLATTYTGEAVVIFVEREDVPELRRALNRAGGKGVVKEEYDPTKVTLRLPQELAGELLTALAEAARHT